MRAIFEAFFELFFLLLSYRAFPLNTLLALRASSTLLRSCTDLHYVVLYTAVYDRSNLENSLASCNVQARVVPLYVIQLCFCVCCV